MVVGIGKILPNCRLSGFSHIDSLCKVQLLNGKFSLSEDLDDQLPIRAGYQSVQHPGAKERVLRRAWDLDSQHIRAKSPGRHLSVTSAGLRHIREGVVLVIFQNVCVHGVHLCLCFGLLTEVTLGLFLHSGDGAVLVCEQKLLELGHLIL